MGFTKEEKIILMNEVRANIKDVIGDVVDRKIIMKNAISACEYWTNTLLHKDMQRYTIISGGVIVKLLQELITNHELLEYWDNNIQKHINTDIDFFIYKKPSKQDIKNQLKFCKENLIQGKKHIDYFAAEKSRKAYTYFMRSGWREEYPPDEKRIMVQYVPRILSSSNELVNLFDMEHLKIYYNCHTKQIKCTPKALSNIALGVIELNTSVWIDNDRVKKWDNHMAYYRKVVGLE